MRICFHNTIVPWYRYDATQVSDYQLDMLYHGLVSLGHQVFTTTNMWWMYDDITPESKKKIWGKGFTMYGLLSRKKQLMFNSQVKCDLNIVGLHHSLLSHCRGEIPTELLAGFSPENTIIIDGWDRPEIQLKLLPYCSKYFKRELYYDETEQIKAISFAFPEEKIPKVTKFAMERRNIVAPLIPVNQSVDPSYMSTYIYEDEDSYYNMYQDSIFALTSKKGGWDTLRHYEIMANGCLPYFVDIEMCPKSTLTTLPKKTLSNLKLWSNLSWNWTGPNYGTIWPHCGVIDKEHPLDPIYDRMSQLVPENVEQGRLEILDYFKKNCLTKHLGNYVLE